MINPNIKICEYCGDEFDSHHGLQRYCPEKFGRVNYCKNEQKKLVNERKLADLVKDVASSLRQYESMKTQLELNIEILIVLLGNDDCVEVDSTTLHKMGYVLSSYSSKYFNSSTDLVEVQVGQFTLEWINTKGQELIFKLHKT